MKEIDCRALPCPQPVINTKNALDEMAEGETLIVLVDNEAAVKNVSRFVEAQGHELVRIEQEEGTFRLEIKKGRASSQKDSLIRCEPLEAPPVVVLASRAMGEGDETLAQILLKAFLKTLRELPQKPQKIICYNEGVFLALEDSEVIEDLRALEKEGLKILVCGTCLDYYRVKDKLAVGEISNMYDIAEALVKGRVIKP